MSTEKIKLDDMVIVDGSIKGKIIIIDNISNPFMTTYHIRTGDTYFDRIIATIDHIEKI